MKRTDRVGKTYGYLKVISFIGTRKNKRGLLWKCLCICGNIIEVFGDNLAQGKSKSCGCKRKKKKSKKLGTKVGKLTVLSTFRKSWNGLEYTHYNCICDCGKKIKTSLINVKSCGCLQRELLTERNKKAIGWAKKTCIWGYYRKNAKDRNLCWKLNRDEFERIIKKNCYYCKVSPQELIKIGISENVVSGIDRKNNLIGYTVENCVPCCKICNRAKLNMELKYFKLWIKRLRRF